MDLLLTRWVGSRPRVLYHLTFLILSRVACPVEDRGWTVSCQSTNSSNAPRVLFRGSFKKYKDKLCRWIFDMILKRKKDPNLGANSFAFLVGPIQCIPRFIHFNNLLILAGKKSYEQFTLQRSTSRPTADSISRKRSTNCRTSLAALALLNVPKYGRTLKFCCYIKF